MNTKHRAISTVLTTAIILVSSVVLGSGVVLYGGSMFNDGAQQESISTPEIKLWVNTETGEGLALGAAKVRNTSDKVITIDTIKIRSFEIPHQQWYADTTINKTTFQNSLNFTGWDSEIPDEFSIKGPVILYPSQQSIIYFKLSNGTLSSIDTGLLVSVSILFDGDIGAPQSVIVEGKNP